MHCLKQLDVNFKRIRESDISGNAENCQFAPGSCPAVENLSISFPQAGKISSIEANVWVDFLRMFSGLKELKIERAASSGIPDFWPRVLEVMPQLRSLKLPSCDVRPETLDSLLIPMTQEWSQLQDLSFDYSFDNL